MVKIGDIMTTLSNAFSRRSNEKEIRKLEGVVERINFLEEEMASLTEEELAAKTGEFKERLQNGETEDEMLPEAFALVREAAKRTTGMRPFDVQVMGGIVLHQGRIIEMKTGDGKTLAATMPAYLNALSGGGVHIVTVNDYLAKRDSEWMGPVYRMLGLSVGYIAHDMSQEDRRQSYAADIVYATNNELGFDYLRDNMVIYKDQLVQRELNFAIVDEVDSILIDEARTPLIISSKVEAKQGYERWNKVVASLIKKQARLVDESLDKAQQLLKEGNKEEAAELLLMARRGAPKNKKLLETLKDPGVEKQVEKVKYRLMSDKTMRLLDEQLYFSIDEATRGVDISPKGYDELVKEDPELRDFLGYEESEVEDDNSNFEGEEGVDAAVDKDIGREKDMEMEETEEEAGKEDEEEYEPGDAGEEEALANQRGGEHEFTIRALLRAYSLYEKDVDYVIKNNQVVIVDEFTGRLMPGRRYSEGLHQAIEAKEGVQIQAESRTVASITFQNFFRLYNKLSGMTGTAATEEGEFQEIYGMDVVIVPTNKPMIREDLGDCIYKTEEAKFRAVVNEISRLYEKGQPVLVGTISVDKSEKFSRMLKQEGVPHNVLNAVNHAREAEIISQAGQKGAVTISTNMAGRGTDIVLGGNYEYIARQRVEKELEKENIEEEEEYDRTFAKRLQEILPQFKEKWEQEHQEVVDLGGLHVLGTERHESRRIDNQLRGRSGRQGDPGSSQFYISLEDDLMRLFGSGNIASVMERMGMDEDQSIDHPLISRAIENAQKKVESRNFEIRKHLLEYDLILNAQRKVIYAERRKVLDEENLKDNILEMVQAVVHRTVDRYMGDKSYLLEEEAKQLINYGETVFLRKGIFSPEKIIEFEPRAIEEIMLEEALSFYDLREKELEKEFGPESMRELERVILLRTVDRHWVEHIDAMHELRYEIGTRAYAQRDPLVEYRLEASRAYELMLNLIEEDVVRGLFQAKVKSLPQRQQVVSESTAVRPDSGGSQKGSSQRTSASAKNNKQEKSQPVKVGEKIGRNAPCPCNSGKKYKKCCGKDN